MAGHGQRQWTPVLAGSSASTAKRVVTLVEKKVQSSTKCEYSSKIYVSSDGGQTVISLW